MSYKKLLKRVEKHISFFYIEHADSRLFYHNYPRAKQVVNVAKKMAAYYQLDQRSAFIIYTACWFHATGYLTGNFDDPEIKSAELAGDFLKNAKVPEEDMEEIKKSILVSYNPPTAETLSEKIVCDSLQFYWGTYRFKKNANLLRKEFEAIKNIKADVNDWRARNISMLEDLHYYTDYCKLLLNNTKDEHLQNLKNKQKEDIIQRATDPAVMDNVEEKQPEADNLSEEIKIAHPASRPIRGIETMFRISSSNSQKISMMADSKAHIMISVNSIIISVVLGLIVGKLDENKPLLIPTIILLIVNVTTISYAVLATRPKVNKGTFTPQQVEDKTVNLLFYGSFYKMGFKEYDYGMRQMMNDSEFLYGSLIKDIYWQGRVLGRKYRLLHISYNVFMYGIAFSVIAYTVAAILSNK